MQSLLIYLKVLTQKSVHRINGSSLVWGRNFVKSSIRIFESTGTILETSTSDKVEILVQNIANVNEIIDKSIIFRD